MFSRVIGSVSIVTGWISGVGIYIMTVLVFIDVLLRYFIGNPTNISDIISIYCVLLISFVGAAYTTKMGKHVSVTLLFDRLSAKIKLWVAALGNCLATIILAIVTWSTVEWVIYTYNSGFISVSTMEEPMWIPLALIPIGFILWTLQYVVESINAITALQARPAVAEPTAQEGI